MKALMTFVIGICLVSGCGSVGKAIDRDSTHQNSTHQNSTHQNSTHQNSDDQKSNAQTIDAQQRDSRRFDIEYIVELSDCPVDQEIKIWIPYPGTDDHQKIHDLDFKLDNSLEGIKVEFEKGKVHGNHMIFVHAKVLKPVGKIVVTYSVERFVNSVNLKELSENEGPKAEADSIYLKPSTLCFVTPQIKREATALSALSATSTGKARRFYDHILNKMSYSKAGKGWGRGDIHHACEVGEGNCTDFHTYFSALCMAAGIESRFQIGMWGKYTPEKERYKTGGYHCWAEFRVPGKGWVPVDISEADKDIANRDKYFGSQTANRVTLSSGRDLILSPAQQGAPINFFVNPYAEIGGKQFDGITKSCYWQDR